MQKKKNFVNVLLIAIAGLGLFVSMIMLALDFARNFDSRNKSINSLNSLDFFWNKNVMFISSYDANHPATELELRAINSFCTKEKIYFDPVFLETNHYSTKEHLPIKAREILYKIQRADIPYNAVIIGDDEALRFAIQHSDDIFSELPVVFFGIENDDTFKQAVAIPNFTGSMQILSLEETIKAALDVMPHASRIVALCDNSLTGLGVQKQFTSVSPSFPGKYFEILNASNFFPEQLASGLRMISSDTIFLLLSFTEDKSGNSYTPGQALNFISENLNVPVFKASAGGIGSGALGGYIFDYEDAVNCACEMISQILNGVRPEDIDVVYKTNGIFYFDCNQIEKFNLKKSYFPKDSIFLNDVVNPVSKYIKVFAPMGFIFISLIILLGVSCMNLALLKKTNKSLIIKNNEVEEINELLKTSEMQLHYLSENDFLTTLPNRFSIVNRIKTLISRKTKFSVMMIDVDDFKFINDYYTHACGDFVLCEIAKRLIELSKEFDCYVARYGGDEFLLVYAGGFLTKESSKIFRIREVLNAKVFYKNIKMEMMTSSGIVDWEEGVSFDELMGNADIALYESKKNGKNKTSCYEDAMRSETTEKNKILKMLDESCSNDGFTIRYQPQINADSGEIEGYEALVRLTDSSIGPGKFIPVAEDGGYITQIGRIVTEKVISQMALWREKGMKLCKVAINYSNGQLVDSDYVEFLQGLLDKYSIPPKLVEIEITESLFMGNTNLAHRLFDSLSKIGVGLALDDFGTGYSSLSYLTYIPVDKVKIDKSLVDNYLSDDQDKFIKNIVRLVHDLGMGLTVEGVEYKWQYEKLKKLHCDTIQGYYFSEPISGEEVETFRPAI